MINEKLKKIIFNRLYEELSNVEIIPYKNSICFIDREKEYWYFEYEKSGILYWKYSFFNDFFKVFSMEYLEFQWIISEWVEEVLNCKVDIPLNIAEGSTKEVEEVLNCKVDKPFNLNGCNFRVEEVLNCKVDKPVKTSFMTSTTVEEVLNHKVATPTSREMLPPLKVGEVLKYKVKTTRWEKVFTEKGVKQVLDYKVVRPYNLSLISPKMVCEILDCKVAIPHHH